LWNQVIDKLIFRTEDRNFHLCQVIPERLPTDSLTEEVAGFHTFSPRQYPQILFTTLARRWLPVDKLSLAVSFVEFSAK
jgi:hypothetical protein